MPTDQSILNKVKLLLNLSASPNPNEANNAKVLADKLIAKHNITEEELASLEEKVFYGENEKLFVTNGLVPWRQQLALCIANYFECQIVSEELVPAEGEHQFSYFVYGEEDQVKDTQFVYHAFAKKVDGFCDARCIGRGPVFLDSYCEGVIEAIKANIAMEGIKMPDRKRSAKKAEAVAPSKKDGLTTAKVKEEPTEKRTKVGSSLIKDIMAYFKGVDDGQNLSLSYVLELESKNEDSPQLSSTQ